MPRLIGACSDVHKYKIENEKVHILKHLTSEYNDTHAFVETVANTPLEPYFDENAVHEQAPIQTTSHINLSRDKDENSCAISFWKTREVHSVNPRLTSFMFIATKLFAYSINHPKKKIYMLVYGNVNNISRTCPYYLSLDENPSEIYMVMTIREPIVFQSNQKLYKFIVFDDHSNIVHANKLLNSISSLPENKPFKLVNNNIITTRRIEIDKSGKVPLGYKPKRSIQDKDLTLIICPLDFDNLYNTGIRCDVIEPHQRGEIYLHFEPKNYGITLFPNTTVAKISVVRCLRAKDKYWDDSPQAFRYVSPIELKTKDSHEGTFTSYPNVINKNRWTHLEKANLTPLKSNTATEDPSIIRKDDLKNIRELMSCCPFPDDCLRINNLISLHENGLPNTITINDDGVVIIKDEPTY